MRLSRLPVAAFAATFLLAACASVPPALQFDRPLVLLGEVHDNAAQHKLRLQAFREWLATGARPVLAMEQFDRQHQAAIDAALHQQPAPTADAVIAAGQGGRGWHWPHYKPFIELALQHGLPIVAANVSRDEARAVMRHGLQAQGFDPAVPAHVLHALTATIEASHCGLLPAGLAAQMALAQVARDQFMARVLSDNVQRGVLLLAGNGHVRTDVGAPRWLDPATRQRSLAIGVLEAGDTTSAFDRVVHTAPQPRPDPCLAMRAAPR